MRLDSIPFPWSAFREDTRGWTKELVGAYLTLWMSQWESNGIRADDTRSIVQIMGESRTTTLRLWNELRPLFQRGKDGKWRDPKLEAIRDAEIERVRMATDHGRRGAEARWAKAKGRPMRSTTYKRGCAIAHEIMDALPHAKWNVWVEEFKLVAAKQGIDYMERGGSSNMPLYMRCLEYVDKVKKRRVARGEHAWRKTRARQ